MRGLAIPVLVGGLMLLAALRGVDVYEAMTAGARQGLALLGELLPALAVLFPVLHLLRASGLPERLGLALAPLLGRLGIPPETTLLMLLRPLSGSAALAEAGALIAACGPDSLAGRTAAVMLGSSETTFYVAAVYFGAAGLKPRPWVLPAALTADLVCFLSSAWIGRLLWSP